MHNRHDVHAFREITQSGFESAGYVCCDCRGKKALPPQRRDYCSVSLPCVGPCSAHARCFKMLFWFDRRMASSSLCGVERFSTNLRDFCPGWRIWLRRLCLIPCARKTISASQVQIMHVQLCSRACAGGMRTNAIKCSLNSSPGGAASQNSWNTDS